MAARAAGWAASALGQPRVIGEIVAGLLLGPSFLGALSPALSAAVLPPAVFPALEFLAQAGVITFMFLVGLDLQPGLTLHQPRSALPIAAASIGTPFLLGTSIGIALHPVFAPPGVALVPFALFVGVALSVTAFPVLARILTERGMVQTELGVLALSCAALNDAGAWLLLALITGAVRIHPLFVAFLAGILLSRLLTPAETFRQRLEQVSGYLLPIFFAITGLRTSVRLLDGWSAWGWCAVILAAASAGKIGGAGLAARVSGRSWREAATLGALMNTRGLVELVVLNLGLELGIISPALFAMLVIMAVTTTLATTPLLRAIPAIFPATGR